MEFLKRHVEKLILGVCLLGLLGCSWYLLNDLKRTRGTVTEGGQGKPVEEAPLITPLTAKEFVARDFIYHPRLEWESRSDPAGSSLFDPRRYIRCANLDCPYLLAFDTDVCPYCNQKQGRKEEEGPAAAGGDDTDGDGMTNEFEKKHAFLDTEVPGDADRDEDGDGFTNLEEYKAKTALDDPKQHPPLARKLRVGQPIRKPLGILFTKVVRNVPDNPQTWDVFLNVVERARAKTKILRIGETVGDYKILAVRYKTAKELDKSLNAEVDRDVSELDLQKLKEEGSEPLVLVVNRDTYEPGVTLPFVFLKDPTDIRKCPQYSVQSNELLALTDAANQPESYRVADPQVTADGIRLQRVMPDGSDGEEFWVPRFDPRRDLKRAFTGAGAAEAPPGMDQGTPGGPGPGAGAMMMGPEASGPDAGTPQGGMMMGPGMGGTPATGMGGQPQPGGGRRPARR